MSGWAGWSRSAHSGVDGQDGDLTLDGEVTTAMLGATDRAMRHAAGLAEPPYHPYTEALLSSSPALPGTARV